MRHKFASFRPRASLAVLASICVLSTPGFAWDDQRDFGRLFGAILNGAVNQMQSQQMWNNRPIAEYKCLEAHNTSAAILANHGIGPYDPRVQRLFAQCNQDNLVPPPSAQPASPAPAIAPAFAIDGLPVGGFVVPDSAAYRAYKCRPSGDYPGFKWCGRHRSLKGAAGAYDDYMTIFHSGFNQAALLLQDIIPAYFTPGDVDQEIQRLSRRFGQAARLYNAKPGPEAPHAVLAVWGDVVLTPLAADDVEALRRGDQIHVGLIVDFLGDSKKSAALGMPIFRIGGGAGYIWSAKYDESGKGRLRITAVNASLLPGAKPDTPTSVVTAYAPIATPIPTPTPTQTVADAPNPGATKSIAPETAVSPPVANFSPVISKSDSSGQPGATPASVQPVENAVAVADSRVALVIGNSAYNKFGTLPNPRKDAALVAETLRNKGFKTVTLLQDATRVEVASALNAFSNEAEQADWAVIYYAGHGIEVGGVNYLLPTDIQLKTDLDVQDEAVSLDRVLEAVKSARKLGMVILDACRDNPFAKSMRRSSSNRAISRGLVATEPPAGIIVVYAAAAGQLANDGNGEHSPFTTALVSRINEPGLDINLLIPKVAGDVFKATEKAQRPFVYGSNLNTEALYFTPPR